MLVAQARNALHRSRRAVVAAAPRAFFSSDTHDNLQAQGFVDEKGWTKFETLHELRLSAVATFSDRHLFGTYSSKDETYDWMTYNDFGALVEKTRTVLKDIGTKMSCVLLATYCTALVLYCT